MSFHADKSLGTIRLSKDSGYKRRSAEAQLVGDSLEIRIPIEHPILCFGTPVVLLSTLNADESLNLAPLSSIWWLGRSCMLGLRAQGHIAKTYSAKNDAVLNVPTVETADHVNELVADPLQSCSAAQGYNGLSRRKRKGLS
jgi:hypothetical protein